MTSNRFSRIKYVDLGVNPETGVQRRQYAGIMNDQEYISFITDPETAEAEAQAQDLWDERNMGRVTGDVWDQMEQQLRAQQGSAGESV